MENVVAAQSARVTGFVWRYPCYVRSDATLA